MGCRSVLRSPRAGGILHWLATLGSRDAGHRDAYCAISLYERRARHCSRRSRERRVETAYAQPDHPSRNPRQRCLLPHPANYCAAPSVAGRLYSRAALRSLLLLGIRGSVARWCTQTRVGRGSHHRHAHDDFRRSNCEMVKPLSETRSQKKVMWVLYWIGLSGCVESDTYTRMAR
jgi:hypothetical protein